MTYTATITRVRPCQNREGWRKTSFLSLSSNLRRMRPDVKSDKETDKVTSVTTRRALLFHIPEYECTRKLYGLKANPAPTLLE